MNSRCGIITVSNRCARGEQEDRSGALLVERVASCGLDVVRREVLPDDATRLENLLRELCDKDGLALVVTTGGTGISPTDVTPEATAAVVEKRIAGLEEALHRSGEGKIPTTILSRAVAGVRGRTLIVNLPGSPGGAKDGWDVLGRVIHHALRLIQGDVKDCRDDLASGDK
ncbi:MAG: MogA/MoaB family molybdenum cofactor biosynthesis protein [bacterium]